MVRAALIDVLDRSAQASADPQAQAALARLKTPEGLAFIMAASLFFMLVGFVVFGSVAGAAAASLRNHKREP
jgi:hypothetical protein